MGWTQMTQRHLFPLPMSRRIEPTPEQLALLDLIALRDGEPLDNLSSGSRMVLRHLIRMELVDCIFAVGPARYLITPVGRMVRARPRSQRHVVGVDVNL